MGSIAGAVVGGGLGLAGSLFGAKKSSDAAKAAAKASEFKPYSGDFLGGSVDFDRRNQTFNVNLSPEQQAIYDQMGGMAGAHLAGGGYGGMLSPQLQLIGNQIPGLYGQAQMQAAQLPTGITNQFMGGSLAREAFAGQTGAGLLGQVGGPIQSDPYAMQALGQGFNAFNTPDPAGYRDVYEQRLGLLRDAAAPYEQRAITDQFNDLYGRGIANASSGALQQRELASGLAQADTQRAIDAMGFSENLWQRDMQNTMQQRNLGLGLIGQGFGAQANNFANQLGQQQLYGNLGANLMGQSQNFGQGAYAAGMDLNSLANQRAMQRLASAQQLFGFGGQTYQQDLNTGLGLLGAQQSMQDQLRNWTATGGNLGGAQASAGANAGNFMMQGAANSPWNALAGFGGGLFQSAINSEGFWT